MFEIQSENITTYSIIIFLLSYSFIVYFKPTILYNKDGSLREFGLNSSKRTITPVWLLSLLLALASYILTMYLSVRYTSL